MGFNPLEEKGTRIEEQVHDWSELNITPYDKNTVHPYTRTRIILMNGIEVEAAMFKHQFNRHTTELPIKKSLALTRAIEQQHQKMVNWLAPGNESNLEVTIGYEQVAVDLTAWLARTEPDKYVKAALDFALLEDFDHLYRYANLLELTEGKQANKIVQGLTEITPGRPTYIEHRYPVDNLTKHIDKNTADILTKLHIETIVSGEQQTMNYYMNIGDRTENMLARGLYAEIAMVEEEHVSHYESLNDPTSSWLEMLVMHEYNECYMYYSCWCSETDDRIKQIWERHLHEEIQHLKVASEFFEKYEKRDIAEILPACFPEPTIFQSNIDYVRDILSSQVDLTESNMKFIPMAEVKDKSHYEMWQKAVNDSMSFIPSQKVIEENIRVHSHDYRVEAKGPNPVKRLQSREKVTV
jgi:hypothetical protein